MVPVGGVGGAVAVRADTGGRWSCAFAGLSVELSAGAQKVASQQEAAGWKPISALSRQNCRLLLIRRADEQANRQTDRQTDR